MDWVEGGGVTHMVEDVFGGGRGSEPFVASPERVTTAKYLRGMVVAPPRGELLHG